jgi:hypothetical protein
VIVAMTCPECGHQRCFNGRGLCRCGVYLIHHTGRPATIDPDRKTFVMTDVGWRRLLNAEPGAWRYAGRRRRSDG